MHVPLGGGTQDVPNTLVKMDFQMPPQEMRRGNRAEGWDPAARAGGMYEGGGVRTGTRSREGSGADSSNSVLATYRTRNLV